jgi:hypothetical protein
MVRSVCMYATWVEGRHGALRLIWLGEAKAWCAAYVCMRCVCAAYVMVRCVCMYVFVPVQHRQAEQQHCLSWPWHGLPAGTAETAAVSTSKHTMCIAHAIQKCAKYCKVLQHRLDILPGQKALIVSSNDCAMATHTAQGLSATIGAMKFGMCGMLKQCMVGDSMLQRPYPPALLKARISCCDYPVKACCSSRLWVLLLNKQPHREARVCGKSTSHKRAQ